MLHLADLQHAARDRIADLLGNERDANVVVSYLRQWLEAGLLDVDTLARVLARHLAHTSLDRQAALWSSFFREVPESLLPELFDSTAFLGRGADAVRLADTSARQRRALESPSGLPAPHRHPSRAALARRMTDTEPIRARQERVGRCPNPDGIVQRRDCHAGDRCGITRGGEAFLDDSREGMIGSDGLLFR